MRNKVLFITTRLFWPADSGRKVVLYNYCKGLHDQLGYDVDVFSFLEGNQTVEDAVMHPGFVGDVRVAVPISAATKAKNLASALIDASAPLQTALFWSKENALAIRAYCEEVRPSFVILDMIRLAPYMDVFDGLDIPVVLDYDDLLSKRYERQIGKNGGNILGNYRTNDSGPIGRLVANDFVKNAVLSTESKRTKKAEDEFARKADSVLFVSPVEAIELDKRLGAKKCFSATIGAEIMDMSMESVEKAYDFGFVGNMRYAANQAALDFVCEEVLPLLPGRTLRVIGVCPDDMPGFYARNGQVSFSGRVETIAGELLKCDVMLAPFAYGSGIKTKVLEAMGMGMPVVTNSLGVEGMTCEAGVEVEVGETAQEIADACKTLLDDTEKRRAVGLAGREYVRRCHDWRMSIENLGKCLDYAKRCKAEGGAQ